METLESVPLESALNPQVSPSGSTLADMTYKDSTWVLRLLTRNGSRDIKLGSEVAYIAWANDHVMVIRNSYDLSADILLMDLLTGETSKLRIPVPELHQYVPPILNHWGSIPYLDSSLQYAIYPTDEGVSIVRVSSGQLMAKIGMPAAPHSPRWAPNGSEFIDVDPATNEIVTIDTNGHIKQLTNIADQYPGAYIISYQWSPDARRIAFWFQDNARDLLAISQVGDRQTKILCVMPEQQTVRSYWRGPIWSPESRYLAISVSSDNGKTSQIYIVDTKEFRYTTVPNSDELEVLGWLAFDPVK